MRVLVIILSFIIFTNIWASQGSDSVKYFDKKSKLTKWVKSQKNSEIRKLSNTLLNELNDDLSFEQVFIAAKFYDEFTIKNNINSLDRDSLFQSDIIQTMLSAQSVEVEDINNDIFSVVRKFGSQKFNMYCLNTFQLKLDGQFSENRISFDQVATDHDCKLLSNSISRVTLVQQNNKVSVHGTAIFSLPKKIFVEKLGFLRGVAIPFEVGRQIGKLKDQMKQIVKDLVD